MRNLIDQRIKKALKSHKNFINTSDAMRKPMALVGILAATGNFASFTRPLVLDT